MLSLFVTKGLIALLLRPFDRWPVVVALVCTASWDDMYSRFVRHGHTHHLEGSISVTISASYNTITAIVVKDQFWTVTDLIQHHYS